MKREELTLHMLAEDTRIVLSDHYNFKNEKTIVEKYLVDLGFVVIFIPL